MENSNDTFDIRKAEALIFDCDGVLVNSEEIVQDIELSLLADLGLIYDRDEFAHRFLGVSNEYFQAELSRDSQALHGRPLPDSFLTSLHEQARQAFEHELIAFEGVVSVLESWSRQLAVASSSSVSGLEFKLRKTQLDEFFLPHVYSAEHVGVGKPDPAIYLHTAEKLNVAAHACIVIEDSVNGVLSAKAAGMHTIGFTAGKHCRDGHDQRLLNAGADHVVTSMQELGHELTLML